MGKFKKAMYKLFIDGLSGMALGLFATLIIGTILLQISTVIPGRAGELLFVVAKVAMSLTGAGIGVGVAYKFKEAPLVVISAAVAGQIGAFSSKILAGTVLADGVIVFVGPGEPLGAFLAAYAAITIGHWVSGKTKVDIIVTPICCIASGMIIGLLLGPPISAFMTSLGALVNWGTEQQPVLMGIIVSVLMGIFLTLPISSAAIGIILNLSGMAAGAAAVGCCSNMIGFAFASYRENKIGGLLAQGLGTSMIQMPNIVKKPLIWLPAIITSAILGPISTAVLGMTNNATGSGMGTAGLVGPIMAFQTMIQTQSVGMVMTQIIMMLFVLPGLLAFGISKFMRKKGWIKDGDMKLDI